jgi:hypothetical protein
LNIGCFDKIKFSDSVNDELERAYRKYKNS